MTRLLWVGPAFPIDATLANPALTPAASRWQNGLFEGLSAGGVEVRAIGHESHRMWPRGPITVPQTTTRLGIVPMTAVGHANIPWLRQWSVAAGLIAAAKGVIGEWGIPDLIASYNAPAGAAAACRRISRDHRAPWTPFILDSPSPVPGWSNVTRGIRESAGVVFVSHWAFCEAPLPQKFHLDSGVTDILAAGPDRSVPEEPPAILYAGALHRWGGVEAMLDAFPLVRRPGARLWIVGKGITDKLQARMAAIQGVTYFGPLPDAQLDDLTKRASVLVNPRPAMVPGNEMNFPSKLLHYLSYAKPVVTTLTPGVAPEYADVVIPASSTAPGNLASALDSALAMDKATRELLAARIRAFLESRLWSRQARRYLDWASSLPTPGCP